MRSNAVRDHIKTAGYRSTRTRDVVVDFLATQRYIITVESISAAVSVDPVTVYRVLDLLQELGIIHKLQSTPAYCTVPQSLRNQEQKVILIDEQFEKIQIRPYEHTDYPISAQRVVIELRGSLENTEKTEKPALQIEETEPEMINEEEVDNSQTIEPSADSIDRLHRF